MIDDSPVYAAETDGVEVRVVVSYLPQQSDPPQRYVWGYLIEIENRSAMTVQLLRRHWIITDALGRVEEVEGPGVVGEQPVIPPGETYRYTSGCPLPTSSGTMTGSYRMHAADGRAFDCAIPPFSLDLPARKRTVN